MARTTLWPFDHASMHLKLLVTPALAIMALALVCGSAWEAFTAGSVSDAAVADLTWNRMWLADDAKLQAAELQATLFRLTSLGLMGLHQPSLARLGEDVTRREAALARTIATIAAVTPDAARRRRLQDALAGYRSESAHAVEKLPGGLRWDVLAAGGAATALDDVIEALAVQERAALDSVRDAQHADQQLNARARGRMLTIMALGGTAMVLVGLLIAQRIADPIKRLTAAMMRLAEGETGEPMPESLRRDEIGSMARAVEVFREGLQRAEALAVQQQATQFFLDTVLEHVPAPILVKRASDLSYAFVNHAAKIFFGVPRTDVIGMSVSELVARDTAEQISARDKKALLAGGISIDERVVVNTLHNGQRIATYNRLAIAGADGSAQYLLTMVEDTTERGRAERRIAYMAHHDALTGLANRVLFGERLAQEVGRLRAGAPGIAVLGLDLDRFKEVNDTFGHAGGDVLLRSMAARLSGCLRQGDTLARLGGDEFAVIQCGVRDLRDAEVLAMRLIETAREPTDLDGRQAFIGISVGVALGHEGMEPGDLVKQADIALYEAKKTGRGCFKCFAPDMTMRLQQRRTLEADLRDAVGSGQFALHYQPQVNLRTGAVQGAEALLRWNSPRQGNVPPGIFVPVAEETGLIAPLGSWVLHTACRDAASWPDPMLVAVNVSPVQLRLPGFLDTVKEALAGSGLPPERLELEVTEGVLLQEGEQTSVTLAALRALGIKLALDDFGTGYASLGYLQRFRFDTIKIDRSFVQGLGSNQSAAAIVRAITGLSQALGTRTIAEGVESAEEVALLQSYGCLEGQGFLFWRPMAAPAMLALVQAPEAARLKPALA